MNLAKLNVPCQTLLTRPRASARQACQRAEGGSAPASASVPGRWRGRAAGFLVGFGLCLTILTAHAQTSFTEYQVKALFLFNFAKYVDWPPEAFASPTMPITIGVLGQDNFKDDLKRDVEGKSINGRSIVVKRVTTDAQMKSCHILFISFSENSRLNEILSQIGTLPVLTVGESDQFTQQGGIINFLKKEGKVRLEVDLNAARLAKLQISSKLSSVADVVKGKSN